MKFPGSHACLKAFKIQANVALASQGRLLITRTRILKFGITTSADITVSQTVLPY
jgi:hypothetical protein